VHEGTACPLLFIDGGANTGESIDAWYRGAFHRCATKSPNRLYPAKWHNASHRQKAEWMAPLARPSSFCVRSYEANPQLMPLLKEKQTMHRNQGRDVRFINASLGLVSGPAVSRRVTKYSNDPAGTSAHAFDWQDIHAKPLQMEERSVVSPGVDIRELITTTLRENEGAVIALKLDVEGGEFSILDALMQADILCSLSYLFVEYHNLHLDKHPRNLTAYGHPEDAYYSYNNRIHALMDRPGGCRLQINWRSFWASCGDDNRFVWMNLPQATGSNASRGRTRTARRGRARRGL